MTERHFQLMRGKDYKYSLDVLPQEYPMFGAQDMRSPALEFEYEDGRYDMCNMRYKSHKIIQGKPVLRVCRIYMKIAVENLQR